MLSLDWAAKVRDAGICVIGGFQSALEKDVLRVLLKEGTQPVVMVLARKLWRIIPNTLMRRYTGVNTIMHKGQAQEARDG